jgi:hypothetical protein
VALFLPFLEDLPGLQRLRNMEENECLFILELKWRTNPWTQLSIVLEKHERKDGKT